MKEEALGSWRERGERDKRMRKELREAVEKRARRVPPNEKGPKGKLMNQ